MSAETPATLEQWECTDEESPPPQREARPRRRRCLCATPYERGSPETRPPSPPAGPSLPPAPVSPPSQEVSRPPAEERRVERERERVRAQAERERTARINGLGRNVLAERAEGQEAVRRHRKRPRRDGEEAGGKRQCLG